MPTCNVFLVPDGLLDGDGKLSLICWLDVGVLERVIATATDIKEIYACFCKQRSKLDGVLVGP